MQIDSFGREGRTMDQEEITFPRTSTTMAGGVSAADVRSVLSQETSAAGTPVPGAGPSISTAPTPASALAGLKKKQSKPDGISRELFALIGQSAPTLTAQLSKPKLKPKPRALTGGGKVGKWYACTRSLRMNSWWLM